MFLAFNIALYAFAICGAWWAAISAKHLAQAYWPQISAWWNAEKLALSAEVATLKARVAALESRKKS